MICKLHATSSGAHFTCVSPQVPSSKTAEPGNIVAAFNCMLLSMQRDGPQAEQLLSQAKLEMDPSRTFTTRFKSFATCVSDAYTCGHDTKWPRAWKSMSLVQSKGPAGSCAVDAIQVCMALPAAFPCPCVPRTSLSEPSKTREAYSSNFTLKIIFLGGFVDRNTQNITGSPMARGAATPKSQTGDDVALCSVVNKQHAITLSKCLRPCHRKLMQRGSLLAAAMQIPNTLRCSAA
mmetsp:Transcript_142168/g.247765  ORF Transcript_142168/g.247765 Transcript_142168/m.247765 type:complete len:234 (+) Transcript_142168:173-874(+)